MSDDDTGIDIGPLPDVPRKRGRPKKRAMSEAERERLTSDKQKEHLKKIGFQKGREKTGGRVPTPKETKEWLAGKSQDVAELLYNMAFDETIHPKERMKAAIWVAEMTMAKAPTQQEVKVDHTYTIPNMMSEINQMRLADHSKPIDLTPIVDVEATPILIEANEDEDGEE